jgi:hypothetical protein
MSIMDITAAGGFQSAPAPSAERPIGQALKLERAQ